MRDETQPFIDESLPMLDPVRAHELTGYGWRGLTEVGEVLEVTVAKNGHAVEVPAEIVMVAHGKPIGCREVRNDWRVDIDAYLKHFNLVVSNYKANCLQRALSESDTTLNIAPTLRAKFNRAMVLLAAGRWPEGFAEYVQCEQHAPFMRPQVQQALAAGLQPWKGESLHDRRLLLLHAHGFGDTLMMLRYVPLLPNAVMVMPPPLQEVAMQFGPVIDESEIEADDYFCPILHLLHFLRITPDDVNGRPYVTSMPRRDTPFNIRRIGIAWSIGKPSDGDYPREIPLADLIAGLPAGEIHSVQIQGADEARRLGVRVHSLNDFADCAELMATMDMIVSVDTAALHLAGAIGHPRVYGLLSHWASWRWVAPWYDNVKLCRQAAPGDWSSALAQIDR